MNVRVDGILVKEKSFEPGQAIPWHHHGGSYGCLMLAGDAKEERHGGAVELETADCSWRPPQARHRFRTGAKGVHALTFEIPEHRLEDLADGGLPSHEYVERRSGTVLALGHRLRAELQLGDAASRLNLESLVYDLVAEAAESFAEWHGGVEPTWLAQVRDRLHDETDRTLTLAELADDAGVHRIHLARSFRRRFGRPLGTYHRRLRLDRALHRVVESDASLSEIALDAGFADQSHFSNLAKRAVGLSPGRLRALCRDRSGTDREGVRIGDRRRRHPKGIAVLGHRPGLGIGHP